MENGDGKQQNDDHGDGGTQHAPSDKRRRLLSGSSVCRRRRLVVPTTEDELDLMEDAYHYDDHDDEEKDSADKETEGVDPWRDVALSVLRSSTLFSSTNDSQLSGLPSSVDALLSSSDTAVATDSSGHATSFDPERSPLMMKFYKSIGVDPDDKKNNAIDSLSNEGTVPSPTSAAGTDRNPNKVVGVNDDIDDPKLSTLRLGQHRRYLQLLRQSSQQQNRHLAQRNEFKILQRQVLAEQEQYRQALERFFAKYRSRYLLGFVSTPSSSAEPDVEADDDDGLTWQQHHHKTLLEYSQWACHDMIRTAKQLWKVNWSDSDQALESEQEESMVGGVFAGVTETPRLPKTYGPTRQIISLPNTATTSDPLQNLWFDIDDLVFENVTTFKDRHGESENREPSSLDIWTDNQLEDILSTGKIVPPPHRVVDKPVQNLLRSDSTAMDLAIRNSCKIVTTIETLEEMLRLPGEATTDWMITTTTRHDGKLTILDLPLNRPFMSPRACLEYTFRESIYQMCGQNTNSHEISSKTSMSDGNSSIRYGYFVFTLPPCNSKSTNRTSLQDRQKSVKVLVRAPMNVNVIINDHTHQHILLHAHLEYFHDQGRMKEVVDSYVRAVLILKLALFGPNAQCHIVRIDMMECRIVDCDSITIPSALRTPTEISTMVNPLFHVQNMIQILHSVLRINAVDSILCLPGRRDENQLDPYSITVHGSINVYNQQQPQQDHTNNHPPMGSAVIIVDLGSVLEQAGTVRLGDLAIKSCRRHWIWDNDRQVPFTFPLPDSSNTA